MTGTKKGSLKKKLGLKGKVKAGDMIAKMNAIKSGKLAPKKVAVKPAKKIAKIAKIVKAPKKAVKAVKAVKIAKKADSKKSVKKIIKKII